MLGRSSVIARNFSQSMVRFSGHGGVPGEVGTTNCVFSTSYIIFVPLESWWKMNDIYVKYGYSFRTCPSACRTSTGSPPCSPSAVFWDSDLPSWSSGTSCWRSKVFPEATATTNVRLVICIIWFLYFIQIYFAFQMYPYLLRQPGGHCFVLQLKFKWKVEAK